VKVISKVTVVVKVNVCVCVVASGFASGQCLCVWLHLASPDVSVDSTAGTTTGLIR